MTSQTRISGQWILSLMLLLGGCASLGRPPVTDANLVEKIEQAHTPADHAALADYYEEQARQAEREGSVRRSAQGHYERWPRGDTTADVVYHYERLIEGYERTASESRAMADWHRRLAQDEGETAR